MKLCRRVLMAVAASIIGLGGLVGCDKKVPPGCHLETYVVTHQAGQKAPHKEGVATVGDQMQPTDDGHGNYQFNLPDAMALTEVTGTYRDGTTIPLFKASWQDDTQAQTVTTDHRVVSLRITAQGVGCHTASSPTPTA